MFDMVIINDDLERAYEELKEILDKVSEYTRDRTLIIIPIAKAFFPLSIQEIKKVQEAK